MANRRSALQCVCVSEWSLEVLREPAEALAVALSLEHRAHEDLERSSAGQQLRARHGPLSGGATLKAEQVAELVLASGSRTVDLVAEHEDGRGGDLLVGEQRLELRPRLLEPALHHTDTHNTLQQLRMHSLLAFMLAFTYM